MNATNEFFRFGRQKKAVILGNTRINEKKRTMFRNFRICWTKEKKKGIIGNTKLNEKKRTMFRKFRICWTKENRRVIIKRE